jgi:hypothetical protein
MSINKSDRAMMNTENILKKQKTPTKAMTLKIAA